MARIIDCDTHFLEPDSVYVDHIDPRHRDLALTIEKDDLGWRWLTHRGRRLSRMDIHTPGRVELLGEQERRYMAGEPCPIDTPPIDDPWEPAARIAVLERNGVDASIVYPNTGLIWENLLRDDVPSLCANMQAYNTWLIEQAPDHRGRLYPVAMLGLRNPDWFHAEIRRCAKAGIKLAMVAPNPVNGCSLAHPDFDAVWGAFQELDMAVCFHVSSYELPLHPAWYAIDPHPANKLLDTTFLHLAAAVATTALIVHGKLEAFPNLRIGITELSAGWVPGHLMHMDGAAHFYERQRGVPLAKLPLRPSEYFRRQVRVNAFPLEGAATLMDLAGREIWMWGSDYPHAEGMPEPSWPRYRKLQPRPLERDEAAALGGGNAAYLIGEAA